MASEAAPHRDNHRGTSMTCALNSPSGRNREFCLRSGRRRGRSGTAASWNRDTVSQVRRAIGGGCHHAVAFPPAPLGSLHYAVSLDGFAYVVVALPGEEPGPSASFHSGVGTAPSKPGINSEKRGPPSASSRASGRQSGPAFRNPTYGGRQTDGIATAAAIKAVGHRAHATTARMTRAITRSKTRAMAG